MKTGNTVGVPEMGAFDRSNEWAIWVFKFQEEPGKTDDGEIYTVFVLSRLWFDARPLAELKLNNMRWRRRRYPLRPGTMTWAEVTSGQTCFTQGSVFVFKGPGGDTEEITLTGGSDREGVIRLARTRIGEYLERKGRRANPRAARRVQAHGPAVDKRKAKRSAKDRSRSPSRG